MLGAETVVPGISGTLKLFESSAFTVMTYMMQVLSVAIHRYMA